MQVWMQSAAAGNDHPKAMVPAIYFQELCENVVIGAVGRELYVEADSGMPQK